MMFEAKESGKKEEKYNIAKNLIAFGMQSENISEVTGLSVQEIEKIRQEN